MHLNPRPTSQGRGWWIAFDCVLAIAALPPNDNLPESFSAASNAERAFQT